MQELVMIKQQLLSMHICANMLHTVECARLPAKIVHERWRNHLYPNDRYNVFHLSLPLSTCITSSLCDPKMIGKMKILEIEKICNILEDTGRFSQIVQELHNILHETTRFAIFCNILQDSARVCKILQESARVCKSLPDSS